MPELYLFYNKTPTALMLVHPHKQQGVSAGWDSSLQAQHASAFLLNRRQFVMGCMQSKKNAQAIAVSCSQVLTVCRYHQVKIAKSHSQGTFWVAEDQPLTVLLSAIKVRGLSPH